MTENRLKELAADQALELRRVALRFRGAGAIGQAVAEGEHHRFARQGFEPCARAACRDDERQDERGEMAD